MVKALRPSLKIRLVSGFVLLAGASLLAFFLVRHGGAASLDGLAPTRFVQTAGPVTNLRFSHDGRLVLTTEGSKDHPLVTFRDAASGSIVHQWPGGSGETWLSEDGSRVMEANPSENGPTRCLLRDAGSGRILRQWTGQILDVRPDFTLMVTADDIVEVPAPPGTPPDPGRYMRPKTGRVVDVATGRVRGRFPLPEISYDVAHLSRTGSYLSLAGYGQPSALLRVPGMTPALTSLPPLRSLRVSRDGTRAFGVDDTGTLHFWRLPSGEHTTLATGLYRADWVSELPDGSLIVQGTAGSSADPHNVVQVRSSDGMHLLRTLPGGGEAFSPDVRLNAFLQGDRASGSTCEVWDRETGGRVARLCASTDALGQQGSYYYPGSELVAASPDARHFALSTGDGLLRFYDLSRPPPPNPTSISTGSGRVLLSFESNGYEPSVFDALVLPDGGVAASGGQDMTSDRRRVQIWHPGGSVQAVHAVVGNGDVERLGVSPDGKTLADSSQWGVWTLDLSSFRSNETPITVASDGTRYYDPQGVGQPAWPDGAGQPMAVITDGDTGEGPVWLTRWDAAGRKLSRKTVLPQEQTMGSQVFDLAAAVPSPDGKSLAVLWNEADQHAAGRDTPRQINWNGILELRDTRSGRLLRTLASTTHLSGNSPPQQGALDPPVFSPDGTRLADADDEGVVRIWDTGTGRKLGQISGTLVQSNGTIIAFANPMGRRGARVAFALGNQRMAVSRDDGALYLYSLRSWLPAAQIGQAQARVVNGSSQPSQPLRWLAFSPDGRALYGIGPSGADVRAWDVPKVSP